MGKKKSPSSAKKANRHEWVAVLLCFFVAFVIWLYVMQVDRPEYEETFHSVSVQLSGTSTLEDASGLSVYSGFGNTVDVTVIGRKTDIDKLSTEDITVTADVSGIVSAGYTTVALEPHLPAGVTLVSISSATIEVYCDEKASTVVSVRPKITSFTMSSEYELGVLEPEYDTIVVTGPNEALRDIAAAQVNLELGTIRGSMKASGTLILVDRDGNQINNPYLKLSRTEVTVQVPVYTYKEIPLTVDYQYGYFNDTNISVEISPSTLSVKGDPAVLDKLTSLRVDTLDEKKISSNVTKTVSISLPSGVESVDGIDRVTVRVTHVGTYTKFFNVANFEVIGADHLKYELLEYVLPIQIRGTIEDLGKLVDADIVAVIDLSGYAPDSAGTIRQTVEIHVNAPSGVNVYEIGEYTLQVKLNG